MTINDYILYIKSIPAFDWVFLICCIGFIMGIRIWEHLIIRRRKAIAVKIIEAIAKRKGRI